MYNLNMLHCSAVSNIIYLIFFIFDRESVCVHYVAKIHGDHPASVVPNYSHVKNA